jgi:1-deoxy-D-xylulose-5-phosphate synthase
VTTTKGKGYKYAQEDKTGTWHGVAPFNIETGQSLFRLPKNELTWSAIISNTLIDLAAKNPDIVAITPAMATGSKLIEFANLYPDRFFDAQIAEQHAMTMAAGMAQAGLQPFISIYSSFLQRAYDQLSHDVARMNLPVVIGVDRAGLVGDDGDTHQGIYDIAFMRSIPNLIIAQPKDAKEAQNLLYTAFKMKKPFALRYPKGNIPYKKNEEYELIEPGVWSYTDVLEPKQIVISYGPDVDRIIKKAKENQVGLRVVNARYIKPLDHKMLKELFESGLPMTVFETDISNGGLSSAILEEMNAANENEHIDVIGIHDKFVPHGSIRKLRELEGINIETLFEELENNEHTS